MTKYQIASFLFARNVDGIHTIVATDGKIYTGFIQSIEREDGSGRSFNVCIHCVQYPTHCGLMRTVHVRTID